MVTDVGCTKHDQPTHDNYLCYSDLCIKGANKGGGR